MKRYSILIFITGCILLLLTAEIGSYVKQKKNYRPYTKPKYNIQKKSAARNVPVTYRFPGEFEKQQAIWMQWPSEVYNQNDHPVDPVMIKIVHAFTPYIRVNILTQSKEKMDEIRNLMQENGYSTANVHYYMVNHLSIWTRDVGPLFVKDSKNQLHVADFQFNNYSRDGSPAYIHTENQVDRLTAQVLGLPVIHSDLISEGGAIESNGKGTLMIPESVGLTRNPNMSKQQISNEYKRVLGVKKVIWLKKGLAEDDRITSGHINEFARFANPNTILLAQVLPEDRYRNKISEESYRRLEENYNILKNAADQDGKPFTIIRVPMPATLYQEAANTSEIPVRSYLNYAVTNGAVIMQTYWKPGRPNALKVTEEQVKKIFQRVFPGRDIIGVDAEDINQWGGGIHCITQHMPAY